jgi:alpha-L-fucosidase
MMDAAVRGRFWSRRRVLGLGGGAWLHGAPGRARPRPPAPAGAFRPTWPSIKSHQVPAWYDDAKFGIFIHWGLYSVPAWAPPSGELHKVPWDQWFKNNAYAEWYRNTMRIEGSPTERHHRATYGADFDYYRFAETFNDALRRWSPAAMAGIFADAGARYVVLTSKHHDGFTLWPSEVVNPNLPAGRAHAGRDVVGDLSAAVRARDLVFGLYYSGGLDWSWNPTTITKRDDVAGTVIHTEAYARYADAHWRELIRRYRIKILWNDIGYPRQGDLLHIFADFYNEFPDGVINNRFRQSRPVNEAEAHWDFETPEYQKMDRITPFKWETCRGLGYSFGYNQVEDEKETIQKRDLVALLVDIVSKNGNLLLNVGPKPDGTIPAIQQDRLRALGSWLGTNGEAIYGTRPWRRAEGRTTDGGQVRFTRKGTRVYAILLDRPRGGAVTLEDLPVAGGSPVRMLGHDGVLDHRLEGTRLTVTLPAALPGDYAWTLEVTPR